MGVVCVMTYKVADGKSGQQTVDVLQKRVEELGAIKTGNYMVDCETYQAIQSNTNTPQRVVHVMHNSEQPATTFCVLDTGTCLVADILMDVMMSKLKEFYAARKNARVEAKGQRYELGDFIIKIGSAVLGQNTSFKGILVEVEYTPCVVGTDCWGVMKEFMQGFMGSNIEGPCNHLKSKMDAIYSPGDTIIQYLEHFNNFRKVANPPSR